MNLETDDEINCEIMHPSALGVIHLLPEIYIYIIYIYVGAWGPFNYIIMVDPFGFLARALSSHQYQYTCKIFSFFCAVMVVQSIYGII